MSTTTTRRISIFSGLVLFGLLSAACGANDGQDPTANSGSDLNNGGATGGGGSGGGAAVDAGPVFPPPPPPGPSCWSGGFGNANGVCSTDVSMLTEAEDACANMHGLLHSFSPDEKCGKGSSNSATYNCCPLTPPPPPPPPPACTKGGIANANGVCSSDTSLESEAASACSKQGLALTSFAGDEKCGKGSSSSATYACCAGHALP